MTSRAARLSWIAAGAAIVVGLVVVVALLERVERTIVRPPGPAARNNPFLAAERFLDRMGLATESRRRLLPLPEPDRLVVLATESRLVTARQAEEVVGWIAAGGHLLIGPHLDRGEVVDATFEDPLLERLGVGVFVTHEGDPSGTRAEYTYDLDGSGDAARVSFYVDFGLAFLDDEDDQTYGVVYKDHGEGRFYVVNDTRFLRNDEIGSLDHARFLWDIVELGAPRTGAVVVYGQQHESLLAMLVRQAWPALLASLIAIGVLTWREAARFGPPLPAPTRGSRSLMDHVQAAGHFLWRRRRGGVLLDAARDALMRRVTTHRPRLARLDDRERSTALAADVGLDPDLVRSALVDACPHRRDVFTRWMRTVETLRRQL